MANNLVNSPFEEMINSYLRQESNYLKKNQKERPKLTVESEGRQIDIYVDNKLAETILQNRAVYFKHLRALKHGYVGNKKGLNGIRTIHERDGKVYNWMAGVLFNSQGKRIIENYHLNQNSVEGVKVVAHDPSGRRLCGLFDRENDIVVLFNIKHYK